MLIEIRKAGFVNKGAYLMLLAIQQALKVRYPSSDIAMAPSRSSASQPIDRIRAHGMLAKSSLWRAGRQWGDAAEVLPRALRNRLGLVLDREIEVVLDSSGFLYGSPWGKPALEELAVAASRWKSRGTRLILMPQAFGAFDDKHAAARINEIADSADLIFARDPRSLENLRRAAGERDNLLLAPDFTAAVAGIPPENPTRLARTVAIIPNARMIDQTSDETHRAYLPFLSDCVAQLRLAGLETMLIAHEAQDDTMLVRQMAERIPDCEVLDEDDPLRLKGILSACRGVIGSRYHGLISSLAQGVPAFGTSWTHKYQALYGDYRFPEGLISELSKQEATRASVCLANDPWQTSTRIALQSQARELRRVIEDMWSRVFAVIDQSA